MLVKTVLSDKNILINNENLKEHSIRILKDYDKIVYIVRKNTDNIKKSLCKLREYDFVELRNMKQNNILRDSSLKEYTSKQVDEWLDIFYSVADSTQIYYYEEIYTENPSNQLYDLLSYLNIQYDDKLFQKYIHPKNRYKDIKLSLIKLVYCLKVRDGMKDNLKEIYF